MPRISSSNVLRLIVTSALCALTLGVASFSAHADDASGEGVDAVLNKVSSLPARLRNGNFATAVSVPQWTPDGGVYQFYNGSNGEGAVYWSNETDAHVIYGAILGYWADHGYETKLGYPSTDEGGSNDMCPSGTKRAQRFAQYANPGADGPLFACWVYLCWNGSEVLESNPICS